MLLAEVTSVITIHKTTPFYLFSYNLYDQAFNLIDTFPDFCLITSLPIRISLFRFVESTIEKYYIQEGLNKTAALLRKHENKEMISDQEEVLDFEYYHAVILRAVNMLGHYMSENAILLCKILRTTKSIADKSEDDTHLLTLLSRTALPSLNLMEGNAPMANEIWELIEHYPFQIRFELYREWLSENTWKSHATLTQARIQVNSRCKWLLKRLTKENVKQYGRQIGKIAHSNPGVLFKSFLSQIQRYENLIAPVVESLRYMTPLAFDTLAFCLMDELQDESKSRLQDDGASIATWLQAMAQFCGQVYKRHNMELGGLLLLIADQLKKGKSIELLLLQDVIYRMTGIEANGEPTQEQMDALSGGDVLRNEGGYYGQIKNFKRSSSKLRATLKEQKLEVALVLLIALHRDRVLFGQGGTSEEGGAMSILESKSSRNSKVDLSGAKLKLVGDMIDMCHGVMYQLGTFLCNCGSEINTSKPELNLNRDKDLFDPVPADVLMNDYHAPVDIAFFLSRRYYFHKINDRCKELQTDCINEIQKKKVEFIKKIKKLQETKKALKEKGDDGKEEVKEITKQISEMTKNEQEYTGRLDMSIIYNQASEECLKDLRTNIVPIFPEMLWKDMNTTLFSTFWTLDNYDLKLPKEAYNKEINRIKQAVREIDEEIKKSLTLDGRTRRQKTREKERLTTKMEMLRVEQREHLRHTQSVKYRMEIECKDWIHKSQRNGDIIMKILQNLVFKRAVFSAEDSNYCANFLLRMHELQTPDFPTLLFFDRLFTDISYTVGSLTEQQAMHYGSFLNRLLEEKLKWHSTKEFYDKHCYTHPGFKTILRQAGQPKKEGAAENKEVQINYESYRHVCNKWQHKLVKASITCLESLDYVQLRNILVILPRLMPNFPKIEGQAEQLHSAVEKLAKEEQNKRQDIRAKSMGYMSLLRQNKGNLVPVEKFHHVKNTGSSSSSNITKSSSMSTKLGSLSLDASQKSERDSQRKEGRSSQDPDKNKDSSSRRNDEKSERAGSSTRTDTAKAIREAHKSRNREGSRNRSEKRESSERPNKRARGERHTKDDDIEADLEKMKAELTKKRDEKRDRSGRESSHGRDDSRRESRRDDDDLRGTLKRDHRGESSRSDHRRRK